MIQLKKIPTEPPQPHDKEEQPLTFFLNPGSHVNFCTDSKLYTTISEPNGRQEVNHSLRSSAQVAGVSSSSLVKAKSKQQSLLWCILLCEPYVGLRDTLWLTGLEKCQKTLWGSYTLLRKQLEDSNIDIFPSVCLSGSPSILWTSVYLSSNSVSRDPDLDPGRKRGWNSPIMKGNVVLSWWRIRDTLHILALIYTNICI